MKALLENYEIVCYETLLFDISSQKPNGCRSKIVTQEGYYENGDPCIMFHLKNKNSFFIRIWTRHMYSSLECKKLSHAGKIFVSASRFEGGEKIHLPLFGWFQSDDYEGIWGKILES